MTFSAVNLRVTAIGGGKDRSFLIITQRHSAFGWAVLKARRTDVTQLAHRFPGAQIPMAPAAPP